MPVERVEDIAAALDTLIRLDEVYASIEKELRDKVSALRKEFEPKLAAVLKDRDTALTKGDQNAKSTPAIPQFWLEVLANSEEFGQEIEEYDEPVLQYLESIESGDLDPTDEDKGFVITFKFNSANPFFTNTELRKTYRTVRNNDFTDQLEIVGIESDKIEWNSGKDVTVELVAKEKSGGGAKKKKAAAAKAEARPSFFRYFRDLDIDNLPSEMGEDDEEDEEDTDELERLQMFMQDDWERAAALKDLILPRAVRWFTGEAVDIDYEEEEDDDEEDEEEDESEDEESDDDPIPSKKELFAKKAAAAGAAPNPEECKQQ